MSDMTKQGNQYIDVKKCNFPSCHIVNLPYQYQSPGEYYKMIMFQKGNKTGDCNDMFY